MSSRRSNPLLLVSPRSRAPVVLTCEHASNRLPPPLRAAAGERRILSTHWGWDLGAWALTRDLSRRLGTSAIGGRWSRLVIDLNRRLDDPTLIRRDAGGEGLSWNDGISVAEIERRILDYHGPYHQQVDRLILQRLVRGVRPLIFSVHSFTPLFRKRRRRFELGVLYEKHPDLAHRLGRALRNSGLVVRYNQPYSGMAGLMYSADRHGTHYELPCLELEVNQALLVKPADVSRLGRTVSAAVGELVAD
jgi:predicted N-formylglutamate amidohydrolase